MTAGRRGERLCLWSKQLIGAQMKKSRQDSMTQLEYKQRPQLLLPSVTRLSNTSCQYFLDSSYLLPAHISVFGDVRNLSLSSQKRRESQQNKSFEGLSYYYLHTTHINDIPTTYSRQTISTNHGRSRRRLQRPPAARSICAQELEGPEGGI